MALKRNHIEIVVLILLLLMPIVLSGYQVDLFSKFVILVIFALSVDLVWGYTGIFTFGHAAFFGWGAYAVALSQKIELFNSSFLALGIAIIVPLILSILLGYLIFSGSKIVSGAYLAIITLAVAFLSEKTANLTPALGGWNGIPGIPPLTIFGFKLVGGTSTYLIFLLVVVVIYLAIRYLVHSKFGIVLTSIRDNEERTQYLGYDVQRIKRQVFNLSAGMAGFSGGLYAYMEGYTTPSLLGFLFSTQVLLWVVIGGRGTLIGPVVGTIVISYLSYILSSYIGQLWAIILGILLVISVVRLPKGLAGFTKSPPTKKMVLKEEK